MKLGNMLQNRYSLGASMQFSNIIIFKVEQYEDVDIWYFQGNYHRVTHSASPKLLVKSLEVMGLSIGLVLSQVLLYLGVDFLNSFLDDNIVNTALYHCLMNGLTVIFFILAVCIGRYMSLRLINNGSEIDGHYSSNNISIDTAIKAKKEARTVLLSSVVISSVLFAIILLLEDLMIDNLPLSILALMCLPFFGLSLGVQSWLYKIKYMNQIISSHTTL